MTLYQMLYTFWWITSSVFKLAGLWAPIAILIAIAVRNIQNESKEDEDDEQIF